ncbi:MAG: DUF2905 domain-containing protein [Deltaproteobacteria bacterium]|nr:DUF2905 domain-containing protein [Deltaproteobacteria bacterium]MBN2686586.1 DUF2905 domain-containing protein [Deltaproteobacteria bacterium]
MPEFSQFGKILIIIGLVVAGVGLILIAGDKIPWLGRLPGDIFVKGKKGSFYFPITTCLIVSALLSFIFYLFRHK